MSENNAVQLRNKVQEIISDRHEGTEQHEKLCEDIVGTNLSDVAYDEIVPIRCPITKLFDVYKNADGSVEITGMDFEEPSLDDSEATAVPKVVYAVVIGEGFMNMPHDEIEQLSIRLVENYTKLDVKWEDEDDA